MYSSSTAFQRSTPYWPSTIIEPKPAISRNPPSSTAVRARPPGDHNDRADVVPEPAECGHCRRVRGGLRRVLDNRCEGAIEVCGDECVSR